MIINLEHQINDETDLNHVEAAQASDSSMKSSESFRLVPLLAKNVTDSAEMWASLSDEDRTDNN